MNADDPTLTTLLTTLPPTPPTVRAGRRRLARRGVVLLMASAVLVSTWAAISSAATPLTVNAAADAYVQADQPDANFGTRPELVVRAPSTEKPEAVSYVKFVVSGLTTPPAGVELRLFSYALSATGVQIWTAPSDWTETGITWRTAPARGSTLVGSMRNLTPNTYATADVSSVVTGNGTYTFAITTTSTASKRFASRQVTANPPRLVINTSASRTVTPIGGSGQSTMVGRLFPSALIARVTAADGTTIANVPVTFTAPDTGPSGTFPGGAKQVTVNTGANGVANSPPFTAGPKAGSYAVLATISDAAQPAAFNLTNTDPTVVAAGDIACPSTKNPTTTSCQQMATSDVALSLHPDAVLPLGDNQYELGSLEDFQARYGPSWGRLNPIAYPVPGNHEYGYIGSSVQPTGGTGYFTYFGDRAHPLQPGCTTLCTSWYSWDIGNWHMIALDSQCGVVGGCNPGNPQYQWLQADLSANTKPCTLAYWHIPLFSSSPDRQPNMISIYSLLYNRGADVVLTGHAHFYERFAPQTASGVADPERGIAQFVAGTGGRSFFSVRPTPAPNSAARIANTFGVLQLTLSENSYSWRFVGVNAGSATDSGTATCH